MSALTRTLLIIFACLAPALSATPPPVDTARAPGTRADISRLEQRLAADRQRLLALRQQIAALSAYEAPMRAKHLENEWHQAKQLLSQPYSQVSAQQLAQLAQLLPAWCEAGLCPAARREDFARRIEAAQLNKQLYDDGERTLCAPPEPSVILRLRERSTKLVNLTLLRRKDDPARHLYRLNSKTGQYKEIDSLDIRLSRFIEGLKFFQQLIRQINADPSVQRCRESGDHRTCFDSIRSYVEPTPSSPQAGQLARYFRCGIPWLTERFSAYVDELERGLPSPTPTEQEVLSLEMKD